MDLDTEHAEPISEWAWLPSPHLSPPCIALAAPLPSSSVHPSITTPPQLSKVRESNPTFVGARRDITGVDGGWAHVGRVGGNWRADAKSYQSRPIRRPSRGYQAGISAAVLGVSCTCRGRPGWVRRGRDAVICMARTADGGDLIGWPELAAPLIAVDLVPRGMCPRQIHPSHVSPDAHRARISLASHLSSCALALLLKESRQHPPPSHLHLQPSPK